MFVRTDLTTPQQAVQSTHAAIEAATTFDLGSLPDHPHVVILAAKNESQLRQVSEYLLKHGIRFVHFYESDLDDSLTAIACEPVSGEDRKLFRKFQCLKHEGGGAHKAAA